jgi:hypothetical protein
VNAFLSKQYSYLFQTFSSRRSVRHKLFIGVESVQLLARYSSLQRALAGPDLPPSIPDNKQCTVILLSHNRPQNLPLLVNGALKNAFVRKVVVSNSNRTVRIADWVKSRDPRLVMVDEVKPTRPGYRFVLAVQETGDYFLSVDDDIFLTPQQWAKYFQCLLANEAVAHGLTGNLYKPGSASSNGSPFHHVSGENTEVDVLIGAYAFTRRQLDRLFELARRLDLGDVTNLANGEDVLLSFAGERRPQIHDVGNVFCCASTSLEGVALWRTLHDFWDERVRLFEQARTARAAMDAPKETAERPTKTG